MPDSDDDYGEEEEAEQLKKEIAQAKTGAGQVRNGKRELVVRAQEPKRLTGTVRNRQPEKGDGGGLKSKAMQEMAKRLKKS